MQNTTLKEYTEGVYVEDVAEAEPTSRRNGDVQAIVAGENSENRNSENYEKTGNQSQEYYAN